MAAVQPTPPPSPPTASAAKNDLDEDFDTDASSSSSSSDASSSDSPYQSGASTPQLSHSRAPSVASNADGDQTTAASATAGAIASVPPVTPSPVCAIRLRRMIAPGLDSSRLIGSKAPRSDAAVPVTPYLLYQVLRSFGFPKRLLVFGSKTDGHDDGQTSRGLAQFDTADACEQCIRAFADAGRWVSERQLVANAEVHLGGDAEDVFSVTLSPARETKVFATTNTTNSLVVTAAIITQLGAPCDRTPLRPRVAQGSPAAAASGPALTSASLAALTMPNHHGHHHHHHHHHDHQRPAMPVVGPAPQAPHNYHHEHHGHTGGAAPRPMVVVGGGGHGGLGYTAGGQQHQHLHDVTASRPQQHHHHSQHDRPQHHQHHHHGGSR